jgi:hypothetical protein
VHVLLNGRPIEVATEALSKSLNRLADAPPTDLPAVKTRAKEARDAVGAWIEVAHDVSKARLTATP